MKKHNMFVNINVLVYTQNRRIPKKMMDGDKMKKFINSVLKATRKYTALDFALLKICLVAIGILFGVYFTGFFEKYTSFVWVAVIISYIWIMYKTFLAYRK